MQHKIKLKLTKKLTYKNALILEIKLLNPANYQKLKLTILVDQYLI